MKFKLSLYALLILGQLSLAAPAAAEHFSDNLCDFEVPSGWVRTSDADFPTWQCSIDLTQPIEKMQGHKIPAGTGIATDRIKAYLIQCSPKKIKPPLQAATKALIEVEVQDEYEFYKYLPVPQKVAGSQQFVLLLRRLASEQHRDSRGRAYQTGVGVQYRMVYIFSSSKRVAAIVFETNNLDEVGVQMFLQQHPLTFDTFRWH